ncbi:MAG: UDP-N-acetylmuramate--L-alanine ligase [Xanthomonadales bacterium]|nr:UDP-N-acetylmuramate--L-alanine ligase [Xanthomonadales bacterium]
MRRVRRVHFVGIGGVGMSGIAEVLVNHGFQVSGSDLVESATTRRLAQLGVDMSSGHDAANIEGADVLVVSSAIDEKNPEVAAAREQRMPVVPRAEMLAELMRFQKGIAVAGTHGKTTTTSLAASLLAEGGLDPTFVIGGVVNAFGSTARLGRGEYLLAEADESDGSFLLLQPVIAVVTNIDRDHLEAYDQSFDRLRDAFAEFLHHLPFYGSAVLSADDPEVECLRAGVERHTVTFGLSEHADVRATDITQHGRMMHFDVHLPDREQPLSVHLNLPGEHNVRNALGAIAVAWELGIDLERAVAGLERFEGIGRRFADLGEIAFSGGRVIAVEDYGHHPSELAVTIAAARSGWPDRRLVAVFQPHRYTRTRDLLDDFSEVLSGVDAAVITDVYAAGEALIDGADSRALCQSIRARGRIEPVLVSDVQSLAATLPDLLADGDLVLFLGAGSIGAVAQRIAAEGFDEEDAA